MKKQYKGFYSIGNDFPSNIELTNIASKIEGVKDYAVVHLEANPSYGIVFDRALTIWPNNGFEYSLPDDELYGSMMNLEHFALIIIGSRQDIDAIYDKIITVFSEEDIQKIVQEDVNDYDTAHYSFHQANLINGTSILHFANFSGILDNWSNIKEKLIKYGVWNNIQYVLEPNDLFNSYFNYFDNWFFKNTSLDFAKEYYHTFKGHLLFPKEEDFMVKSVLKKIKK